MRDDRDGEAMSDDPTLVHVGRLAELGLLTAAWMHEVRQPLTAIQATAEMAIAGGSADAARWRKVLGQVRQLRALVDGVAGLGRSEGFPSRVDLGQPIAAALTTLQAQARSAGVSVSFNPSAGPMIVRARPSAVQQLVVNLVHNGIDAARRGGGHVWLSLVAEEEVAVLDVADDGPGVAPSIRDRLFEPFATDKPDGLGTGLGLFIVQGIVLELGGEVTLGPREGGGTLAVVRLPLVG